jgi:hypothetical protein
MKKCRNHELDTTIQFFNTAGSLYSVHDNVENVDVQAEEQQAEDENSEEEDDKQLSDVYSNYK